MNHFRILLSLLVITLAMTFVGCGGRVRADIVTARTAFDAGDYQQSYDMWIRVMQASGRTPNFEAAYHAGLSAYRLKRLSEAQRLFKIAARTSLTKLRGQSLAELGLVFADQRRFDHSSRTLSKAAEYLTGQDRANAYYYAAVAEQRLNRAANARTLLVLADRYNLDNQMKSQISEKLSTTGYTIQLGVYADAATARAAGERLLAKVQGLRLGYPRVEHRQREDGKVVHLLQIGSFSTFNAAATKRHELGINDAVIVVLTSVQ